LQYFGGKHFTADKITDVMNTMIKKGQVYLEPFVGGGSIVSKMRASVKLASDSNPYLIAMYQALQKGWVPPLKVSEDEYNAMKRTPDINPDYKNRTDTDNIDTNAPDYKPPAPEVVGFAGHACAFYGIWFNTYARDPKLGTNFAEKGRNTLLRLAPKIKNVKFYNKSYLDWKPKNAFIYCDPPYSDTTQPYYTKTFDTDLFWETMRKWSETNTVVISEYSAPDDFFCIAEIPTKTCVFFKDKKTGIIGKSDRIEKLFSLTKYNPWEGIF